MGISEEELPGIGRRYELDVRGKDRLVAVVHNDGQRDLFAFRPGDVQPAAAIGLDATSAYQLAAVLTGAYHRPAGAEPVASIIDRFRIESIRVADSSELVGRSIADLEVRRRTGASVVSIVMGRTSLVDPQPSTLFNAGDLVVVVGQPRALAEFRALARGPEGAG